MGQVNESGTDCRTDAGVTVGLIDAIITLSRLLKKRDKSDKSVEEALKDLQDDEDFADLLQNLNIKTASDLENVRKKIAETGPLTFLVQKSLELQPSGSSNFREEFLKMKPGLDRENFILEEIKKRRPIKQLVPVTVPGPKGTTITYYVMPDYITIDGIRVPMAGQTAQKVADYFGMALPTAKQVKQIWEAADVKFRPQPLSAGGVIGGKHYSGQEVVQHKISDSDAAIAYSDMIEQESQQRGRGNLNAGYMKSIVRPEGNPDKLSLYGWLGEKGDALQPSARTPHDTSIHVEYGAAPRLVAQRATITLPNGQKVNSTVDKLLDNPLFAPAISNVPGATRYNIS